MKIRIQKTNEDAVIPKYAHDDDSGMDVYSTKEIILQSMARTLMPLGFKIAVPKGYEAQIRTKSGLALKQGISVANSPGTIDAGYRGEMGVILINYSKQPVKIEKSQKIAQMVIQKVEKAEIQITKTLDKTKRGSGGFGSTGLK
jgi:dUTP pyrophosphatase